MLRNILHALRFAVTDKVVGAASGHYLQITQPALNDAWVFRLPHTDCTVEVLIARVNGPIIQPDHQLEIGEPFVKVVDGWQDDNSSKRRRDLHGKPTSRSVPSASKHLFRPPDLGQDPYAMPVVLRSFRSKDKVSGRPM